MPAAKRATRSNPRDTNRGTVSYSLLSCSWSDPSVQKSGRDAGNCQVVESKVFLVQRAVPGRLDSPAVRSHPFRFLNRPPREAESHGRMAAYSSTKIMVKERSQGRQEMTNAASSSRRLRAEPSGCLRG